MHDALLFLGGFLFGILITICLGFPAVGRAVARILGVIALAIGVGFLVWVSVTLYRKEDLRPPFGSDIITEVGEALGWGAGFVIAGVVGLVVSFLRRADNQP